MRLAALGDGRNENRFEPRLEMLQVGCVNKSNNEDARANHQASLRLRATPLGYHNKGANAVQFLSTTAVLADFIS